PVLRVAVRLEHVLVAAASGGEQDERRQQHAVPDPSPDHGWFVARTAREQTPCPFSECCRASGSRAPSDARTQGARVSADTWATEDAAACRVIAGQKPGGHCWERHYRSPATRKPTTTAA